MPQTQTSPFNATIQEWAKYANHGDTNDIQNLYTTKAVALFTEGTDPNPPGTPSALIQGAANIVADLGKHFGPNNPFQNIQLNELDFATNSSGGWSYGTWTATVQQQGVPGNGTWTVIWVPGSGNTPWLIQLQAVVPAISET
jgi:hypothetical protein